MGNLLILGAGGQGKVVLDCALRMNCFEKISFLDDNKVEENILGHPVIGKIQAFPDFKAEYQQAFVAIGNNSYRLKLIDELIAIGYDIPIMIHPSAVISPYAEIGKGAIILPGAILNVGCKVGKGVIVNTSVVVEHDCRIADGVHLSPMAKMGGDVSIGEKTWVCIGATLTNGIKIGKNCVVAAGAVVIGDVEDQATVFGIPAKSKK